MLQFSETLQQVLDCQGVLHAALEKGFVAIIEGFLREELADATDFRKETWQHGEAYEALLGRALEHSGGPPERLRLQLQARARREGWLQPCRRESPLPPVALRRNHGCGSS